MVIRIAEYYLCMKHGKYGLVYYVLIQQLELLQSRGKWRGDSYHENSLKHFNGKYKHVS